MSTLKQEVYKIVKKDETVLNGYDAANPSLEGAVFQCNFSALDYSPENFLGADGGTNVSNGDLLRWSFAQADGTEVTKVFQAQDDYVLTKAQAINTENGDTAFQELSLFEDEDGSLYKSASKYFTRNFTVYSAVNLASTQDFNSTADVIVADNLVRITSGGFKTEDAITTLYASNTTSAVVADVVFANSDGLRRFEGEPSYYGMIDGASVVPDRTWFYFDGLSLLNNGSDQLTSEEALSIGAGFFFNNTGGDLDFSDISAGSAGSTGNIADTTGSTVTSLSPSLLSDTTYNIVYETTGNTDVLNGQIVKIDDGATFGDFAGFLTSGRSGLVTNNSGGNSTTSVEFELNAGQGPLPNPGGSYYDDLFNGTKIEVTFNAAVHSGQSWEGTTETKSISSFNGSTFTATLSGALSATPTIGDAIKIIYPGFDSAENLAAIQSIVYNQSASLSIGVGFPAEVDGTTLINSEGQPVTSIAGDLALVSDANVATLTFTPDGVKTLAQLASDNGFSLISYNGVDVSQFNGVVLEANTPVTLANGEPEEGLLSTATISNDQITQYNGWSQITFTGGVADVAASSGMGAVYADQSTIDGAADEGAPITSYVLAGDTGGIQVLLKNSASMGAANVDEYSNLVEATEYSSVSASNKFWTESTAFGSPISDIEDPTASKDAAVLALVNADDLKDPIYWDKISENFVEDKDLAVGATGVDGASTLGNYSTTVVPRVDTETYQTIEVVSRTNGTATDNMVITTVIKHGIAVGQEAEVVLSNFSGANGAEINALTSVKATGDKTLEILNTQNKVVDIPSEGNYPVVTKNDFTDIVWEKVDLPTSTQALIYKA